MNISLHIYTFIVILISTFDYVLIFMLTLVFLQSVVFQALGLLPHELSLGPRARPGPGDFRHPPPGLSARSCAEILRCGGSKDIAGGLMRLRARGIRLRNVYTISAQFLQACVVWISMVMRGFTRFT